MALKDREKQERKFLYFDLICGLVSSIISLIGIVYVGLTQEITHSDRFIVGLTFWIFYLIFSIFMICLGIYLWYREKYFDEEQYKNDLKAPIV